MCGRSVCGGHARLAVICEKCKARRERVEFLVREAEPRDRKVIGELVKRFWGEDVQTAFGREFRVRELPAFVAVAEGRVVGFVSFAELDESSVAIVAVGVLPEHQGLGIGKALLRAVEERAKVSSKKQLLVSTTNDDLPALAFYQLAGFRIYEVIPDAIAEKHGGEIPGIGGIPIRDEIRLYKPVL